MEKIEDYKKWLGKNVKIITTDFITLGSVYAYDKISLWYTAGYTNYSVNFSQIISIEGI